MFVSSDFYPIELRRKAILDHYRMDEEQLIETLLPLAELDSISRDHIFTNAKNLVAGMRDNHESNISMLLQEFSLSSEEGVVLMCLAEALLRVPDQKTADRLIKDKLSQGNWSSHLSNSDSLFVNASAWALLLTGKVLANPDTQQQASLLTKTLSRLGEPVIRAATRYAMGVMGAQFVMGKTIESAIERASTKQYQAYYSYDMLGEGARTMADANRYFTNYTNAIKAIGQSSPEGDPTKKPGISVKLSALYPRYEFAQQHRVMSELTPKLKALAIKAKQYNIGLTVDAEEASRLDLSLDVIEAVYSDKDLNVWDGFGLAVQAYQKRALHVIDWVESLAIKVGRRITVRLVKGAYWDSEIKWGQVDGLDDYPVFTCKASTDISYQLCAKKLLAARAVIYPQFATHNAYTIATILELDTRREGYEFQRLHGMGQAVYEQLLKRENVRCRIYAPVGEHEELLAYLVRRLLENGANSSFVNNMVDAAIPLESLLANPADVMRSRLIKRNAGIPKPIDIYSGSKIRCSRRNSQGFDFTDIKMLNKLREELITHWGQRNNETEQLPNQGDATGKIVINPANATEIVGYYRNADSETIKKDLLAVNDAFVDWSVTPLQYRCDLLNKLADAIEVHRAELMALCIKEAGKTIEDSASEIREAVDFCRYYARSAIDMMANNSLKPLGVVLCISPWNYPLAIFIGQVSAALVVGNTVLAKPSEQTSLIAARVVQLFRECGLPINALKLICSPGKKVGALLLPDERIRAVMFTGSNETSRNIVQTLAKRTKASHEVSCSHAGNIPFIAETGGQNAMIVDSTALPEQVVEDVITSGFTSAGQRCSSLRVLYLQNDIADKMITMLKGAMDQLVVSDPALLSADIGPVIDAKALTNLHDHARYIKQCALTGQASLLHRCELTQQCQQGYYFAPLLFEISDISLLKEEVFGPIVHIIRYEAEQLDDVIDQINTTGFGLTLGVHSRIQTVVKNIIEKAKVGNLYINRNMVGAVVGVQPFGGRGLSGTGPKAGGPLYLRSLLQCDSNHAAVINDNKIRNYSQATNANPSQMVNSEKVDNALIDATSAQLNWQSFGSEQRGVYVARILSVITILINNPHENQQFIYRSELLMSHAETHLYSPQSLPGPTGESNQLLLEGRGIILVIVDEQSSLINDYCVIISALLTANSVVIIDMSEQEGCMDLFIAQLHDTGIPKHLIQLLPVSSLRSVLNHSTISGVTFSGTHKLFSWVQSQLSTRTEAIIPLMDSDNNDHIFRMVVEKTVSVNTTAAGGNISLITL